jgi:transcriptional regulator with XRE-family HTH domain
MNIQNSVTDDFLLRELGRSVKEARIAANSTQSDLAKNANVSLSTVVRLESGHSIQLDSFIRILRVLRILDRLNNLFPEESVHPMELLRNSQKERKRVSSKRTPAGGKSSWKWGDEK